MSRPKLPPAILREHKADNPMNLEQLEARIAAIEKRMGIFPTHPELSELAIMRKVAINFGLQFTDLLSPDRHERLAWPRQIAMFLLDRYTNLSSVEIGALFRRDHGTVLHAIKTVQNRASTDPKAKAQVDYLVSITKPLSAAQNLSDSTAGTSAPVLAGVEG